MSEILITKKHRLSAKKARAAAELVAADLEKEFNLEHEWDEEGILHFERMGVHGQLTLGRGEVTIHTAYRHGVRVRAAKGQALRGAPLEIRIQDNGPGIPAHLRESLFQPFVTSKNNGMGVGLSISRTIIEAHGGRIEAHSEGKGRGCRFVITLPGR